MINKLALVLLFTLPLLCLSGCKNNDNPVNPIPTPEIVPLKVGNSWTYQETWFDSLGRVVSVDTVIHSVLRDTAIGNHRWYILHQARSSGSSATSYVRDSTDGIWEWVWRDSGISVHTLKYPGTPGDTFETHNGYQTVIVSTAEHRNTLLGIMNCYHYSSIGSYLHRDEYLAPGIGRVGFDMWMELSSGNTWLAYRLELINYHLV